jgi:multiple sugar transport system substrate-binding protein
MSKKRHARIAAAALMIGALSATGCSAGGGGGEEPSDDTLVIWSYYTAGGQLDALDQQNELWNEANPDVKIEHVQIPFDQLPSRLLATASTQDGPDVVLDNVVVDYPSLVAGGVLADLTDYWDGYADKDLFGESAALKYGDGNIYNVMSYTNLLGLYSNEDILAEYGLEVPTTLEEFDAAMATVAEAGQYTPLAMSGAATVEGAWMFMPLILNNGGSYCSFEGDAVSTGFETLDDWARSGYIPADTATWDQADAWQAFMSGDYAFGINGNWNLGDVPNAAFEMGTARYPAGPEGSFVFPGGEGIGIGAFSDKKDLAWEYIETAWMSEEASLINFAASGQIPTRTTVAEADEVASNELAQPFIEAAGEAAAWPGNEQTAAMQNAVGAASSGLISGQFSTQEAIENAIADVEAAREAGGGGC